jgi:putative transposase
MDKARWARFGEAAATAPRAIQWLSDNAPQYTTTASVLCAHELGLVPITTPAYSQESNGLAEAFVKAFKRDSVGGAELRDAESVSRSLAAGSPTTTSRRRMARWDSGARRSTGRP